MAFKFQFNKTKYTRCFYTYALAIFTRPQSTLFYSSEVAIFIYAFFRLSFIMYVMWFDYRPTVFNFRTYDPILRFFADHRHQYDAFLPVLIFLFELFNFACQTAVAQFDRSTRTWNWWKCVIVDTQDAYFASLKSSKELSALWQRKERELRSKSLARRLPGSFLNVSGNSMSIGKAYAKVICWWSLEEVEKEAFFQFNIPILPLSKWLRIKLIQFLRLVDFALTLAWIAYGCAVIAFCLSYATQIRGSEHPFLSLTWMTLEVLLVVYVLAEILTIGAFFTVATILGTLVFAGHTVQLTTQIRKLLRKPGHSRNIAFRRPTVGALWRYLEQHNRVCDLVVTGSRQLFGSVLLAFLYTNIPVNVNVISQNILGNRSMTDLLLFWIMALFQVGCFVAVFAPLAWVCSVYHSPTRFIPSMQLRLKDRKWIWLKVKYDDLYNRLLVGPKMGVSIGPLKVITYMAFVEFLLLYLGYLLMAFNQLIEK